MLNVHRNHKAYQGRGEGGGGGGMKGDYIPIATTDTSNDFCVKISSDESHFSVSLICKGQNHKTLSTNHNAFEEKGES